MKTNYYCGLLSLVCLLPFDSTAVTNCIQIPSWRLVAGYVDISPGFPPGFPPPSSFTHLLKPVGTFDPIFYAHTRIGNMWSPSVPTTSPGGGFIVSSGTACFPDTLPSPVLPLNLPAGFSLVCCQTYEVATFEMIVGRSPDSGTQLYKVRSGPEYGASWPLNETNYLIYTFADGVWSPEAPTVGVAEAVWIFQPPIISNPRIVADKFNLEVLTANRANTAVEYKAALEATNFWEVLTNFVGWGNVSNVVDNADINSITQRFYRVKLLKN
ncbi:MAG: hypothetical protein AAB380_06475 [Verrucomicrobiota bacterium]